MPSAVGRDPRRCGRLLGVLLGCAAGGAAGIPNATAATPHTGAARPSALAGRTRAEVAPSPVAFSVALGRGARLGRSTPLTLGLRIDPQRVRGSLTQIQLLTPTDLDIALSGLGLASCRRPDAEFTRVFLGPSSPATCPGNALLATGTADAVLRFGDEQVVPGDGTLRVYSGAPRDGVPGLVALVATANPLVSQLAYAGVLSTAPAPFGLGLRLRIRTIPEPPFDATVALSRFRMTLGGPDIIYTRREGGHVIRYRPGGIPLPESCPRRGFRFRALLRFDDGTRRSLDDVVRCPRRRVAQQTRVPPAPTSATAVP